MPSPTVNRWDKIGYFNVRNHLIQLYKAPQNFLSAAITQVDRVTPVSAPPVNGRPAYIPVITNSNFLPFNLLYCIYTSRNWFCTNFGFLHN